MDCGDGRPRRRGRAGPLGGDELELRVGSRRELPVRQPDPPWAPTHHRADRSRDGNRGCPRRHPCADEAVPEPAPEQRELDLHLVLPRYAAAGADPDLLQHRGPLPDDRPRHPVRALVHPHQRDQPDHAVLCRHAGAGPERGRLHVGDRPGGDHLGGRGPVRRRQGGGHDPGSDDAAGGAPAGDASDHPADRQRDDLDAEEQLAGLRDRRERAAVQRHADLLGQLQGDSVADRRLDLVPRRDHRAVDRPVLPGAPLRARRARSAVGDADRADVPWHHRATRRRRDPGPGPTGDPGAQPA